MNGLISTLRRLAKKCGLGTIVSDGSEALPQDFDPAAMATIRRVQPYTMTSPERLFALIQAVRYVSNAGIPGDIVECGVWKGGSMMAAALTLLECQDRSRDVHLFDTFEGMTGPTDRDTSIDGVTAQVLLQSSSKSDPASVWCCAALEDVIAAMRGTGYDTERVHFVKGPVEETIPGHSPARIAILRLDTDWYESTMHELTHLFPRLSQGGVLLIDDYGHWKGCRAAVDEYFADNNIPILLNRIDYTGRLAVKMQ
ncbi:MAG: class I SAM-dependent methyltransferase [Nitrospira sp.]|nr:class I SAM-dependent methyltransferase [Nitrospira sp.]